MKDPLLDIRFFLSRRKCDIRNEVSSPDKRNHNPKCVQKQEDETQLAFVHRIGCWLCRVFIFLHRVFSLCQKVSLLQSVQLINGEITYKNQSHTWLSDYVIYQLNVMMLNFYFRGGCVIAQITHKPACPRTNHIILTLK